MNQKRINLSIAVIVLLGLSSYTFGQSMVAGGTDTVTVGSKVAYSVDPDPVILADPNMDPSDFDWFFTDMSDVVTSTGMSVEETKSGSYYDADSINVTWSAAAGSQYKVKVAEVSVPQFGSGCRGNEVEQNVQIVARPTIDFQGAAPYEGGGCGVSTFDIPLSLSGYGPFEITFTVEKNQDGSPVTHTETIGYVGDNGTVTTYNLSLDNTHFSGNGRYDVVITNVADRFSAKSLDQSAVASQASDLPGTNLYTIGIAPTPTTSPIRHLRNL